jgi:hypothetical protein
MFLDQAERGAARRVAVYKQLAELTIPRQEAEEEEEAAVTTAE